MRLALFHAAGHLAVVLCVTALVATVGRAAPYPGVPSVALGTGQSMVVAYNGDFQPLRKYVGLTKPTDVTVLPHGRVLLVDGGARRVMLVDLDGTIQWSEPIGDSPIRARPRPGGGFLITSTTGLIAIRADRTVEWRRAIKGIKIGVPLATGNILFARNEGNGWLVETTPNGAVVWQSKPRGYVDASGRWINERPEQYFASVWSLDVGSDGTIFTTDFDRHQLRILSADHRTLRTIPGLHHVTDTRIGRNGELIAVSPEDFRVWVEFPDGTTKSFQPALRPSCASMSPDGRLLVGLVWEPERAVLNATAARARRCPHIPWRQRGLPIPILGVFSALLVGIVLRRPELRAAWGSTPGGPQGQPADGEAGLRPIEWGPRYRTATHAGRAVVWVGVLSAALLLAWSGISGLVQGQRFSEGAWRFAVGCIAGGIALRVLNAIAGCSRTLSFFVPSGWRSPARRPGRGRLVVLVVLSLGSLAGCMYVQRHLPAEQAIAVALWLMAQIWIVAAAFPPVPRVPPARTSRSIWVLLGLVLLGAIVTRFWQIGYYPDIVHHDHSIYGEAALETLRGNWQRFFVNVYSVGRPWIVACAAGLELFGTHYWVLRLLGAISGVVIVWGTYLLGAILFNRRIGLIAALLVTVNHALLLYSRQPYVLDPVAPLVLAVYCAAVGLRRGCRWHWCLSGLLSGWALLAYRSSVTFVPIGVALLVYLAAVYPRRLWRHRAGVLWFVAGACVVYLPMLGQTVADSTLYNRAAATIVLLNPNGSLRWDSALWAHQLGRSFGALVYHPDSAPWGVSAGKPVCLRYGSCLFGIGLIYLLTSWRTPVTFLMLVWAGISIFLGSATLPDPPTYYHFLAAIVPIMLTSAVALDRLLALTDRWRPKLWRIPPLVAALVLLGVISTSHLNAVWLSVRRPPPRDGRMVLRADTKATVARFVGAHRDYRHYLVRSRNDVSVGDPIFRFFAADSDLSDLSTALADALPITPVDPAVGASFIVLPRRSAERDTIMAMYPTAKLEEVPYWGGNTVWAYLVDAKTVRRVYDARHAAPPPLVKPSAVGW